MTKQCTGIFCIFSIIQLDFCYFLYYNSTRLFYFLGDGSMGHKCFISFKMKDIYYKEKIQEMDIDMIDKSLDTKIDSKDPNYVLKKIREDYLADSTVTIHLIGSYSNENLGWEKQQYIKRELQASLYNGSNNTRNGILGVVLPDMIGKIYLREEKCSTCGETHIILDMSDQTVVKEFSCNYFIQPKPGCCWDSDHRYCVLVKWDDFKNDPESFIQKAYDKRDHPISKKVTVYP